MKQNVLFQVGICREIFQLDQILTLIELIFGKLTDNLTITEKTRRDISLKISTL